MVQAPPPPTASTAGSAPASEKPTPLPAPTSKPRSCVVCRSRKVRCDKQTPCSNCRRANIACVVPANDRPPKWARRLERVSAAAAASAGKTPRELDPAAGQVMERLRNLEGLVKQLSGQLELANAAAGSAAGSSSGVNSPETSAHGRDVEGQASSQSPASATDVQKHFGRLVLQDSSRSRYVGSGFWSRVSDELDELKMNTQGLASDDSDSSEDEESSGKTPSTQELGRTPSERHGFMFGHNLGASTPDLREFRPLPSQIPFLLDVFSESVNFILQIVHMPSVSKMLRGMRGSNTSSLTPANEALAFSIYYSAVTSMEDEDVVTNFGATKAELNLKYRLGLEHALAKADFLNVPDIVLIQAFTIFLFLARRHDSPRFVWMMTGLVLRMAQAIGLQRDPSHFEHLSLFEAEMRRRVWWVLCTLDVRTSEDQGTEFTIASESFDTKFPLNINSADIGPETSEPPVERKAVTDMSLPLVLYELCVLTRQMMAPAAKGGGRSVDEQSQLLDRFFEKFEQGYLQYTTDPDDMPAWGFTTSIRLVTAKYTLFIYLPTLFSSPSEEFSGEVRNKLFKAALEVAELNHVLNAEQRVRQFRWIFQTYTHWYSVVYLLIEVCRRQWSPMVERAWVALHSSWLIPTEPNMDKNLQVWVPLRKLMAKARKHRQTELERLRGDAAAIEQLEMADRNMPVPDSSGPFPVGKGEELFREHWRGLVGMPADNDNRKHPPWVSENDMSHPSIAVQSVDILQQSPEMWSNMSSEPPANANAVNTQTQGGSAFAYSPPLTIPADWSRDQSTGPGFAPWLWADADPTFEVFGGMDVNMDVDADVNWNAWLESIADAGQV
ncbi:hypothetical protein AK830_g4578 [Neonectria ditissima]|uniref:Zn(2)-C6 fungal-type domain-containing protein n=1 Tax=Neonectria ditissima TaxID=78410 RepID=A0A0P7BMQ2_9HYPO|nr:hypothetical protein AK830_g4578 [Neonectria ditissima]